MYSVYVYVIQRVYFTAKDEVKQLRVKRQKILHFALNLHVEILSRYHQTEVRNSSVALWMRKFPVE